MLIGPGGVGKSSLLNGLMKKKFSKSSESTQGADLFNLRPTESYWARSTGGHWEIISDEDEIKELAQLVQRVQQNEQLVKGSRSKSSSKGEPSFAVKEDEKFNHPSVKAIVDEIKAAYSEPDCQVSSQPDTEVYLRVWDCGGQPVFLNLLSAFLTARTLFLLMFDASLDLHGPCLHLTHHEGRATEQLDDMSTLQLMVQWMATVHATLLGKGSVGSSSDDGKVFPRILPVGTHGDKAYAKDNKDAILRTLAEASCNKAFSSHLLDGVVVDNTTGGDGESEDPAFQIICEIANKFAQKDLAIDTPITWVLFRKVFERYSRGKPVVAIDEVKELAKACLIPEETVSSVLAFYHDLSVFFHYSSVPSLKYKVISDPQWLIKQMAKILALEGFEEVRSNLLWNLLREDGILVETLYSQVLSKEEFLKPQEIMDLLEHFLIIANVYTSNKHKFPGREYFVPSMLPRISHRSLQPAIKAIQSAAPLHLTFSTNYLPPGFFPRLVTVLSKYKKIAVDFKEKLYRNSVKFHYGHHIQQIDKVTTTEEKLSVSIQVHRILTRPQNYSLFPGICLEILQILNEACEKIKEEWFPGIDIGFAFECKACREKDHFIPLQVPMSYTPNASLCCQNGESSALTPEKMCWFGVNEDTKSSLDIPNHEILEVANEIERCGMVAELRKALERSDDADSISAKVLLDRWQVDMKFIGSPPRPHLMHILTRMGMNELHTKLFYEEFKSDQYELVAKKEINRLKEENLVMRMEVEQLRSSSFSGLIRYVKELFVESSAQRSQIEHEPLATGSTESRTSDTVSRASDKAVSSKTASQTNSEEKCPSSPLQLLGFSGTICCISIAILCLAIMYVAYPNLTFHGLPQPNPYPDPHPLNKAGCIRQLKNEDRKTLLKYFDQACETQTETETLCEDYLKLKNCNDLQRGNKLAPFHLAKSYLEQNPRACCEHIVRVLCELSQDSLAMEFAEEYDLNIKDCSEQI